VGKKTTTPRKYSFGTGPNDGAKVSVIEDSDEEMASLMCVRRWAISGRMEI
jgi:hypothetical protein